MLQFLSPLHACPNLIWFYDRFSSNLYGIFIFFKNTYFLKKLSGDTVSCHAPYAVVCKSVWFTRRKIGSYVPFSQVYKSATNVSFSPIFFSMDQELPNLGWAMLKCDRYGLLREKIEGIPRKRQKNRSETMPSRDHQNPKTTPIIAGWLNVASVPGVCCVRRRWCQRCIWSERSGLCHEFAHRGLEGCNLPDMWRMLLRLIWS